MFHPKLCRAFAAMWLGSFITSTETEERGAVHVNKLSTHFMQLIDGIHEQLMDTGNLNWFAPFKVSTVALAFAYHLTKCVYMGSLGPTCAMTVLRLPSSTRFCCQEVTVVICSRGAAYLAAGQRLADGEYVAQTRLRLAGSVASPHD